MKIKIYSTPTCPWCHRVKEFLREKHIKFEDIDVAANREKAQEMVEKSGQMGVPVIDIDGKVIIGFDKTELEETLNI